MNTSINSAHIRIVNDNVLNSKKTENNFWKNCESNRFAILPILLVVIVCTGGIATAYGAYSDTLKLSLVVFPTIVTLAFTLAVSPMKLIIWMSILSVALDLCVLAVSLF